MSIHTQTSPGFGMQDEPDWFNHYTLPINASDPTLHLFFYQETATTLQPQTGLSASSFYQAHAIRPGDTTPIAVELSPELAQNHMCKFWEIDPKRMPGLYGIQIPITLRPEGLTYLYLCFPEVHPQYFQIQGVAYDPYDSFAMGLETWIRSSCHENLSSGLRKSMPSVIRPLLAEWFARPIGG